MEYLELFEKSKINEKCLKEARKVFKVNFHQAVFFVAGPFVDDKSEKIQIVNYYHVHLRSLNGINATLNNFGDLIRDIRINFEDINVNDGKEIVKNVNQKSFGSLININFENCKGTVLDGLKKPFENVTILTFASSQMEKLQVKDDQKLCNFFPNTNSLSIERIQSSDWKLIDCSFPKIFSINLNLPKKQQQHTVNGSKISSFFKKNSKMYTLILKNANLKVLNEANKHLSNIQSLEINGLSEDYYLDFQNDTINFKFTSLLTIRNIPINIYPEWINFNSLSYFALNVEHNFTNNWMEFFENQINLTINTVILNFEFIEKEQFLNVLNKFMKSESITIYAHDSFTLMADDIINFVIKNEILYEFEIFARMERSEQIKLRRSVRKQWMVQFTKIFNRIYIKR